ncbi:hypothetical protein [Caudoviricetes sp.]|nr:hypothetical protein [Caudoviricetes sp.]
MEEVTTTDLSKFGYIELDMAADLLKAISRGVPDDFEDDGITVMFNRNSGMVFLTNAEYQVAVLGDDDKLVSFYSTPYEGHEGTFEELKEQYDDMNEEDQEYMRDIAEANGYELPEGGMK